MSALNGALDLGLSSVVLLGLALGAVVALVPDATTGRRLAGFLAGFAIAMVGYFLRAALLPDTASGRTVALVVVILLCTGAVALSMGNLPFWSVLLGAGALAGAYELTYSAAPTEILETSVSAGTSLLLTVAVGFCLAALASADRGARAVPAKHTSSDSLDQMMEDAR